ncbi:hypothetical protein ACFX11_042254 [Malus domestica]
MPTKTLKKGEFYGEELLYWPSSQSKLPISAQTPLPSGVESSKGSTPRIQYLKPAAHLTGPRFTDCFSEKPHLFYKGTTKKNTRRANGARRPPVQVAAQKSTKMAVVLENARCSSSFGHAAELLCLPPCVPLIEGTRKPTPTLKSRTLREL